MDFDYDTYVADLNGGYESPTAFLRRAFKDWQDNFLTDKQFGDVIAAGVAALEKAA